HPRRVARLGSPLSIRPPAKPSLGALIGSSDTGCRLGGAYAGRAHNCAVATESVDDVLQDLKQTLNLAAATHAFSTFGLAQALRVFASIPKVPENPDPTIYIGIGDPNNPSSTQYANP